MSYARKALLLAATIAGCAAQIGSSQAQMPPRFDDPGCGGVLCSPRDPLGPDPRDPAVQAAMRAELGPPCGGILCDLDPRGMRRPASAGDVVPVAAAPVEAMPTPGVAPKAGRRHAKARAKAKKRTADAGQGEQAR